MAGIKAFKKLFVKVIFIQISFFNDVSQGMQVPDRSFVTGVPARIKGQVSSQQLWWVEEGPRVYDELAKQYKEQGL